MADDQPLLDVRDLSLDFGTTRGRIRALRNVCLTVPRGRIVGVVGESGCGKSTLAYSLMGLLPANAEIVSGTIGFEGQDLRQLTPAAMRAIRGPRMSMIFQDPMTALNPVTTVGRQMVEIQYRDKINATEKRRRAVEMLKTVGIPDADDRFSAYPHHFSGGMRQRICIAMALLMNPSLLIADEPTTALDATLEVQIIDLLKALQRSIGCSIVFVSHHLGAVASLCDDIVVMYAGEVIETGTVSEIFHHPAHPYTKALFECDPGRIKQKTRHLPTIAGDLPNLIRVPDGCIFKGRCPEVFDRCHRQHPADHAIGGAAHVARCHRLDQPAEMRA